MTVVAPFSGKVGTCCVSTCSDRRGFKNAAFAMDMNHDIYTEIVDTRSLREGGS